VTDTCANFRANSVTLRLQSTPFAGDPEGADAYYAALGRFIVLWGRFELNFDLTIFTLFMLPEARPMITDEMPKTWKLRSAIWRRLFREIERLAPFRVAAAALVVDARKTVQKRNRIYHSGFQAFAIGPPLALKFAHVSVTEKKVFESEAVSIDDLLA
jgi:hypothetical protein